MIRYLCVVGLCLVVAGFGCSSIAVQNDFDKDANFRSYASWDWLENRPGFSGRAVSTTELDPQIDEILRAAVAKELNGKGYKKNRVDPDVLLVYHIGSADQIDVGAWGYQYGRSYWGWHGVGADVYSYRAGTLIVDLVEAKTMTLVWRGAAQPVIAEGQTLESAEELIPGAVHKMFKGYPPAQ